MTDGIIVIGPNVQAPVPVMPVLQQPDACKDRKGKSDVHKHFKFLESSQQYVCNHCRKEYKKDKFASTSNLIRHMRLKHPEIWVKDYHPPSAKILKNQPTLAEAMDPRFVMEKTLTQEKLDARVVEFIISTDQSFTIVENSAFRNLFAPLPAKLSFPSADTIKSRMVNMFKKKKDEIKAKLRNTLGKISFVLDAWTSPNQFAFQGVICQWIDESWELREIILALDILKGAHTGAELAESFIRVLEEYELLEKVASVTTDNASNYDAFFVELERLMLDRNIEFSKANQRVRCLAHIVNLACQDALTYFKSFKSQSRPESVEGSQEDSSDESESDDENGDVGSIMGQLRRGIIKLRTSPQRRETFRRQCQAIGVSPKELLKDNKTRWNSTYDMLSRASELKVPLESSLRLEPKLRKYILSEWDWERIDEIVKFLKPFKRMTLLLEKKSLPTMSLSAMVYIELYNHLEQCTVQFPIRFATMPPRSLQQLNFSDYQGLLQLIETAATRACTKLNKYYPSSDGLAFIVGTILDPRCKMAWYTSVGFEKAVVISYKRSLQNLWSGTYKPAMESQNVLISPDGGEKDYMDELFATQMKKAKIDKRDELKVFLDDPVLEVNSDALKDGVLGYWKAHEAATPNLAKMARDYLCISGTGVPIERFFSNGPELLTPRRRRMLPETVEMCLCLKGWLKSEQIAEFRASSQKYLIEKMCGSQ